MEENIIKDVERNDEITDEVIEEMRKSLEKLAKDRKAKAQKRKTTNNFDEILVACTRDELKAILAELNIKFKSSDKKELLIETLRTGYKDALSKVFKNINTDIYYDLKSILDENGKIDIKLEKRFRDNSYLEKLGVLYLSLDEEKNMFLVAPEEALEVIKTLDVNDTEKNDKLIDLIKGMTYYYGSVSLDDFINNLPEGEVVDKDEFERLLIIVEEINGRGLYVNGRSKSVFLHSTEALEGLLEKEGLKELPFKKFSEEELLRASIQGYIGEKSTYEPIVKIFKENYKIPDDGINGILMEMYIYSQLHTEEELKGFLLNQIKPSGQLISKINNALHKVYNKMPLWKYKGFTAAEKAKTEDNSPIEKIGRNDKCPCGSGKKYKKCCGK